MNGTFTIPSDLTFNAGESAHLSRAAGDPRRQPARLLHEGALHRDLRPGQVAAGRPPHGERRAALRPGVAPDAEPAQPAVHRHLELSDRRATTSRRALGFTYAMDDAGRSVAPRRLRRLLPADGLHVPDADVLVRAATRTRSRSMFPANNRTRARGPAPPRQPVRSPTAPSWTTRPSTRSSRPARSTGTSARSASTTRIARTPGRGSTASATSGRFGATLGVSAWTYIRSEQRDQYVLMDLNPGIRDTTLATSTLRRVYPDRRRGRRIRRPRRHTGQRRRDHLQQRAGRDDQAAVRRIQRAAVLRVLAWPGQRGHRPGRPRPLPAPRRPQPGSGIRADQRGPAARLHGGGLLRGAEDEGAESERRVPRAVRHALLAHGHDQRPRPQRAHQQ